MQDEAQHSQEQDTWYVSALLSIPPHARTQTECTKHITTENRTCGMCPRKTKLNSNTPVPTRGLFPHPPRPPLNHQPPGPFY
eukprot:11190322-Lingulodinium_polyedra.AAC.1